ncbi:MAG: uroporphyrinogen-III C-methyltransferase [Symplocastrum torsivum CPER-KK1]|jgi:uroporphyrinogen III methyltransferase/synthase|uniref:uroporphyrinogen-III C-methyltransferase n=1 Tax=Symplocastrum torsivum CPER-KK1 TaxID=450513 RepID=A0A951PIF2_9CYAN|nr:uroporphyrinogen-III C-methyltransferase [Symplocastrum torsivum CPER-KK1]
MGKVYLVGAGPGHTDYLTVKAQRLLSQADVLIYDALVDAQLLELVPPDCLKLDVGKRGGQPSTSQTEINQLLVEHCRLGKRVVRLKSGDPFIFGRSSSEIQALIQAGCPFEVVPGVSSALAAPLFAGIPLTDSVLSRCFAVVSAHEPGELDWEALARLDTLAILMGGRYLDEIVQQLQRHGRSHSSPIAIIRWAGCPQQQIWTGTLANIVKQTAGVSLSPVVIVVGEVVGLRDYLQSPTDDAETLQDMAPLSGKTILVTRAAGQSSEFSELLKQQGAQVVEMPTLVITPPSSWDALDNAIAHLSEFDWLILTSGNGVDYFFERLLTQDKDARALSGVKIAVVGKKTAASLKQRGLHPNLIPPDFVADSLVEHFPEPLEGKKILFPRVESGGREVLVKEFTAKGAVVTEVATYQSGCPAQIAPAALDALQKQAVDVITFASSKTVKHFCQLLDASLANNSGQALTSKEGKPKSDYPYQQLQNVCIASIGTQTSATCYQLLGRVDVEAKEYTLEGLTQAIVQWATDKSCAI